MHPTAPAPSGMAQAGRILILVGAILNVAFAFLLVLYALLFAFFFGPMFDDWMAAADPEVPPPPTFMPLMWMVYVGLAVVEAAGAVVGFLAYAASRRGDHRRAGILGIVSSILIPVNPVTLVGAILALVSPEAQRQGTGASPAGPPN